VITDFILELFFDALEGVATWFDSILPTFDLSPFSTAIGAVTSNMGFVANFINLSAVSAALAFIVLWEAAWLAVKVALKLWRLMPFV